MTPEEKAARERRRAEKARQREAAQQLAASQSGGNHGQTSSNMAVNPPSPALVRKNSKNRQSNNPTGSRNSNTDAFYGSTSAGPRRASNQQAHPYSQGLDPYGNDPYRSSPGGVPATERSLVGNSAAAIQTPMGTTDRRYSGRAGDVLNEQDGSQAPPRSVGQKIIDLLTCRCG